MLSTELFYVAAAALVTLLMWLPYGLNMIGTHGTGYAVGNRDQGKPLAAWAERAKRAHWNALQNVPMFIGLALVLHAGGMSNSVTVWASTLYFWLLVAHYIVYCLGIVVLRTLVWTAGWICLLVLAYQALV